MTSLSKRLLSFRRLGILIAVILLTIFVSQLFLPTQASSRADSRLSRLESQNVTLSSRISRLENQIARLSQEAGIAVPDVRLNDGPMGSALSSDPMFERLATLVIEQRERIDQLESRLTALERSRSTQ